MRRALTVRSSILSTLSTCAWLLLLGGPQLAAGHGAYHDVVEELTRRLEATPDDADLRFTLACAHQEHGEWALALAELERVERLAPARHPTGWVRGQALATGGHWQAAKGELDRFLTTLPGHAGALALRGRVLLHLGQAKAALDDFQAALKANANPSPELCLEATAAMQAAEGTKPAAELLASLIDRQTRPDPGLLARALELDVESGRLAQALTRVDALQATAPRPEPWMARRAELLAQAGRNAESRAAWQALHDHLAALPSLERGIPLLVPLAAQARQALGLAAPAVVAAPPAP